MIGHLGPEWEHGSARRHAGSNDAMLRCIVFIGTELAMELPPEL